MPSSAIQQRILNSVSYSLKPATQHLILVDYCARRRVSRGINARYRSAPSLHRYAFSPEQHSMPKPSTLAAMGSSSRGEEEYQPKGPAEAEGQSGRMNDHTQCVRYNIPFWSPPRVHTNTAQLSTHSRRVRRCIQIANGVGRVVGNLRRK